jgi:tRNA A37 threonylcarbamoyladenosine dehydratase
MPFSKNDKNINRDGRVKGVPNTKTKELKFMLNFLFSENIDFILDNLDELTLKERLQLQNSLLPYVIPVQKELETMEEGIARLRMEMNI